LSAKTKEAPPPLIEEVVEEIVDRIPMLDPMADAPRDGRWCEVTEDGERWQRARFYQTRMRTAGSVAWVPVSCWSISEPSRYMHRVQNPVAWRWPVEATLAV
jgi:hypothetical protein